MTAEQGDVVGQGAEAEGAATDEVVDEHRLDLGIGEDVAVALGHRPAEGAVRRVPERDERLQHRPQGDAERHPHRLERPLEPDRHPHQATAGAGVVADERAHAAEDADAGDAVRVRPAGGEGVGPAAGETDDGESVVAELIGDRGGVGPELGEAGVLVAGRVTDAGTFDADDPEPEPLGSPAAGGGHLAAGTRRAVAPQDEVAVGIAELRPAQRPAPAEPHDALAVGGQGAGDERGGRSDAGGQASEHGGRGSSPGRGFPSAR